MLFYTPHQTPRLLYIADFIGKELLGKAFQITDDTAFFQQATSPKINYSNSKLTNDEYWIVPHTLLFEQGVNPDEPEVFESNGVKTFFKTDGDFFFDIFAASFYLLSRYEEYLPLEADEYGRYNYANSLAWNRDFLHVPLVNQWIELLKRELQKKYPSLALHKPQFRFLPTYDIDEAYSYLHKDGWRSAGATIKAMLKGDWSRISQRRRVISGKEPDPFDSYEWMDKLHERYNLKPHYFFLVPHFTSKYDRNILPKEKGLQDLIYRHAAKYPVGVHPSWQSGDEPKLIEHEIKTIEDITGKKVTSSRQHFIRLTMPETYRHLLAAGIKEDYSMGYGSVNGFRASVASPFYWYDLEKEMATDLLLYPFCYMDANSFYEWRQPPAKALQEMRDFYNEVKAVNGLMITLWHNTFLGTDIMFKGWKEVYEQFIKEVS